MKRGRGQWWALWAPRRVCWGCGRHGAAAGACGHSATPLLERSPAARARPQAAQALRAPRRAAAAAHLCRQARGRLARQAPPWPSCTRSGRLPPHWRARSAGPGASCRCPCHRSCCPGASRRRSRAGRRRTARGRPNTAAPPPRWSPRCRCSPVPRRGPPWAWCRLHGVRGGGKVLWCCAVYAAACNCNSAAHHAAPCWHCTPRAAKACPNLIPPPPPRTCQPKLLQRGGACITERQARAGCAAQNAQGGPVHPTASIMPLHRLAHTAAHTQRLPCRTPLPTLPPHLRTPLPAACRRCSCWRRGSS